METKICRDCKTDKPLMNFYKSKTNKGGFQTACKDCAKKRVKENSKNNEERIAKYQKEYSKKNRESLSSYHKKYRDENKEAIFKQKKEYREKNKERIAEKKRADYKKNKAEINARNREYSRENRGKINKYVEDRITTDPLYALRRSIPKLFRISYKRKSFKKGTASRLILGCSYEELLKHLNNNPYSFKCGDEGLDFDHIIPLISAETEEEITKLNHYTNLQLLPSEYNRNIKKDNPWDQAHFEQWLKNGY